MIAITANGLADYVSSDYAVTHDIDASSVYQLCNSARIFERWHGGPCSVSDVTEEQLSRCLMDLREEYSQVTLRKLRGDLLCILRDAAESGARGTLKESRVRKIAKVKPQPKAYSHEQAQAIIQACLSLPGYLSDGIPRGLKIATIGNVAWDTALRRGDLRRLSQEHFSAAGIVQIAQKKTGEPIVRGVDAATLAMVRRCGPMPCNYPGANKAFYYWWDKAIEIAGVPHLGSLKAMRKSAATDVRRINRGAETEFLGHTTTAADVNYIDHGLIETNPTRPTPLNLAESRQKLLF